MLTLTNSLPRSSPRGNPKGYAVTPTGKAVDAEHQGHPGYQSRQQAAIFDKTVEKITKYYFDPAFNGIDWPSLVKENHERIVALEDPEEFELAMHDLVRRLRTSRTGVLPSINPSRSGPACNWRELLQHRSG